MNANICCWCIQKYTCQLTTPILTVCPIFGNKPPEWEPDYKQLYLLLGKVMIRREVKYEKRPHVDVRK